MNPDALALKKATRQLIEAAGGQTAAATRSRVGQSKLSEYASPHHPDRFIPADVAADIEDVARRDAQWPHVTRALALRHGFALVALPEAGQAPIGCELHLATVHKETTDVVQQLLASLQGGVSAREARAVRIEIAQALQALVNLDGELRVIEADTS